MNYRLTRRARNAIADIHTYLARLDERAADRLVSELQEAIERLGDHPLIGHTRTDLTKMPWRFWSVGPYMIVHKGRSPVEIFDILDARRDLARILR